MTENTENFICIGLMTHCPDCFSSKGNIRVNQHNPDNPRAILSLNPEPVEGPRSCLSLYNISYLSYTQ